MGGCFNTEDSTRGAAGSRPHYRGGCLTPHSALAAETVTLERTLSELVNPAYGLPHADGRPEWPRRKVSGSPDLEGDADTRTAQRRVQLQGKQADRRRHGERHSGPRQPSSGIVPLPHRLGEPH